MIHYFIRSDKGQARLTYGADLVEIEQQFADSHSTYPNDWHSPIYSVDDESFTGPAPTGIVFVDGADRYVYPDGHMELKDGYMESR